MRLIMISFENAEFYFYALLTWKLDVLDAIYADFGLENVALKVLWAKLDQDILISNATNVFITGDLMVSH